MQDIAWGESKGCIVFQEGELSISKAYDTELFIYLFN